VGSTHLVQPTKGRAVQEGRLRSALAELQHDTVGAEAVSYLVSASEPSIDGVSVVCKSSAGSAPERLRCARVDGPSDVSESPASGYPSEAKSVSDASATLSRRPFDTGEDGRRAVRRTGPSMAGRNRLPLRDEAVEGAWTWVREQRGGRRESRRTAVAVAVQEWAALGERVLQRDERELLASARLPAAVRKPEDDRQVDVNRGDLHPRRRTPEERGERAQGELGDFDTEVLEERRAGEIVEAQVDTLWEVQLHGRRTASHGYVERVHLDRQGRDVGVDGDEVVRGGRVVAVGERETDGRTSSHEALYEARRHTADECTDRKRPDAQVRRRARLWAEEAVGADLETVDADEVALLLEDLDKVSLQERRRVGRLEDAKGVDVERHLCEHARSESARQLVTQ